MLRKLVAAVAVALSLVAVPLAPSAHAAAYGPKLATQVGIKVLVGQDGKLLEVQLHVTASDGTSPAGTIAYNVNDGGSGQRVAARVTTTKNVPVSGSAVVVGGPVAHVGQYLFGAKFTPTDTATYLPSSNATTARIGAVGAQTVTNNGGTGSDNGGTGGLPNTGGPALGWLIAGLALTGAGASTVLFSRRRVASAA